ncbi:hypothetical protein IF1G_02316 [Cordyceps javanica]|uniref:Uncharacterized protein n=1 Tax=Cordyceps javanica TaxID=43265 RepID=A0A545V932_9HYPO|nr:hypothetical protein IF1G_02316 [Cordyceps javanica]
MVTPSHISTVRQQISLYQYSACSSRGGLAVVRLPRLYTRIPSFFRYLSCRSAAKETLGCRHLIYNTIGTLTQPWPSCNRVPSKQGLCLSLFAATVSIRTIYRSVLRTVYISQRRQTAPFSSSSPTYPSSASTSTSTSPYSSPPSPRHIQPSHFSTPTPFPYTRTRARTHATFLLARAGLRTQHYSISTSPRNMRTRQLVTLTSVPSSCITAPSISPRYCCPPRRRPPSLAWHPRPLSVLAPLRLARCPHANYGVLMLGIPRIANPSKYGIRTASRLRHGCTIRVFVPQQDFTTRLHNETSRHQPKTPALAASHPFGCHASLLGTLPLVSTNCRIILRCAISFAPWPSPIPRPPEPASKP